MPTTERQAITLCGECDRLAKTPQFAFYPAYFEYYCGEVKRENWLGFLPIRKKDCPLCKDVDHAEL